MSQGLASPAVHVTTLADKIREGIYWAYEALHRCLVVHNDIRWTNILRCYEAEDHGYYRSRVVLCDFEGSFRTTEVNALLRERDVVQDCLTPGRGALYE